MERDGPPPLTSLCPHHRSRDPGRAALRSPVGRDVAVDSLGLVPRGGPEISRLEPFDPRMGTRVRRGRELVLSWSGNWNRHPSGDEGARAGEEVKVAPRGRDRAKGLLPEGPSVLGSGDAPATHGPCWDLCHLLFLFFRRGSVSAPVDLEEQGKGSRALHPLGLRPQWGLSPGEAGPLVRGLLSSNRGSVRLSVDLEDRARDP